jgi:hypothetical protein
MSIQLQLTWRLRLMSVSIHKLKQIQYKGILI